MHSQKLEQAGLVVDGLRGGIRGPLGPLIATLASGVAFNGIHELGYEAELEVILGANVLCKAQNGFLVLHVRVDTNDNVLCVAPRDAKLDVGACYWRACLEYICGPAGRLLKKACWRWCACLGLALDCR